MSLSVHGSEGNAHKIIDSAGKSYNPMRVPLSLPFPIRLHFFHLVQRGKADQPAQSFLGELVVLFVGARIIHFLGIATSTV